MTREELMALPEKAKRPSNGMAQIKPEGYMLVTKGLPFMDKKCRGVVLCDEMLSREEYATLLILRQPYF